MSQLASNLLERNAARPGHLADFDQRPGFYHLVKRRSSVDQSVWTTSRWLNAGAFVLLLLLTPAGYWLFFASEELRSSLEFSAALEFLAQLFCACVLFLTCLALVLVILHRSQLVVDRARHELRFSTGLLFRRTARLLFADIRALKSRMLELPPAVAEASDPDTRAIFAELYNGDLVLIAADADWRKGSLHREIEAAINASRGGTFAEIAVTDDALVLS